MAERIVVEDVSTKQGKKGDYTWVLVKIQTTDGKTMSAFESACPGLSKVTKGAMLDVETEQDGQYTNITKFEMIHEGEKAKTQADFEQEKYEKQIVMDGGAVMKAVGMCYSSVPQSIRDNFNWIAGDVLEAWRNLREGGGMVYENGAESSHIVPIETAKQNLRDNIKEAGMTIKELAEELNNVFGAKITPTKASINAFIDSLDRDKMRKANKSVQLWKLKKEAGEDGPDEEGDESLDNL